MTNAASSVRARAERRIGTTLREKYRLTAILGVGGMATVYRAEHRNGGAFAIKVLHAELAVDARHQRRFVREGYVANAIEHRSAVRVIDDDTTEDGCPFLVMDLLEGETLTARLRRAGPMAAQELMVLGYELCQGFAAAHDAGIVHRDIKPDNLFLTTNGELKILDFGIARMLDVEAEEGSTVTGQMLGTPAFMPPEQAMGLRQEIGPQTDVFALGATLFRLYTGSTIHLAETQEQLVVYAATRQARKVMDAIPKAKEPLAAVIDKALAFEKAARFSDMRAMGEAFRSAYRAMFDEEIREAKLPNAPAQSRQQRSLPVMVRSAEQAHAEAATVAEPQGAKKEEAAATPTQAENAMPSETTKPSEIGIPVSIPAGSRMPPTRRTLRERKVIIGLMISAAVMLTAAAIVALRPSKGSPDAQAPAQSASPSAEERCSSSAECTAKNGGKTSICRAETGACVKLATEHCEVIAEPADLDNRDTVWIGAMFPESDKNSKYGPVSRHELELAQRDFAKLVGGLPAPKPGGKPRPIGIVACDDSKEHVSIAAHLVDEVGVPAILGFARSQEVIELAQSQFIPKGVLALCSNTASMISSIPHPSGEPRLVWRFTVSADAHALPRAKFLEQVLEPMLQKAQPKEALRLAVLRIDNTSGMSHTDGLLSHLSWNGRRAAENGEAIRVFVVSDPIGQKGSSNWDRIAADVVAYRPDVILSLGTAPTAIAKIARGFSKDAKQPIYLVGGELGSAELIELIREKPNLSSRILNIDMSASEPAVEQLVMHYNEVYRPPMSLYDAMGGPYDAFYVFAFAAASLGDQPMTGRALARAIPRLLPPGEPISVGPAGIYPALSALAAGKNVDLQGAATTLDFDLRTGDAPADMAVYCIDPKQGALRYGGLTFRASTQAFSGKLLCR